MSIYTNEYSPGLFAIVKVPETDRFHPWNAWTTFLLDSAGQTTAIRARTGEEGDFQRPFTPVNAAVASTTAPPSPSQPRVSTTTSTSPSLPTNSPPPKGPSAIMMSMISVGVVFVLVLVVAGFFLWRRAARKRELSSQGSSYDSSLSSDEKPSSTSIKAWKLRPPGKTTWDNFMGEIDGEYARFDESKISSNGDYPSRIGEGTSSQGGYRETAEEKQERLWRLTNRGHSPPPSSLDALGGEKDGQSVDFGHGYDTIGSRPWRSKAALRFPLSSILKRPPTPTPSMAGIPGADLSQSSFVGVGNLPDSKAGHTYKPSFIKRDSAPEVKRTKKIKGVRFGEDQVREFGRTPMGSRATSVLEQPIEEE
ncbi:MAG: hypothetical protein Q9187_005153 [Circinaria calcarea]